MPRYKPYSYEQTKMIPINFDDQILEDSFEQSETESIFTSRQKEGGCTVETILYDTQPFQNTSLWGELWVTMGENPALPCQKDF